MRPRYNGPADVQRIYALAGKHSTSTEPANCRPATSLIELVNQWRQAGAAADLALLDLDMKLAMAFHKNGGSGRRWALESYRVLDRCSDSFAEQTLRSSI